MRWRSYVSDTQLSALGYFGMVDYNNRNYSFIGRIYFLCKIKRSKHSMVSFGNTAHSWLDYPYSS